MDSAPTRTSAKMSLFIVLLAVSFVIDLGGCDRAERGGSGSADTRHGTPSMTATDWSELSRRIAGENIRIDLTRSSWESGTPSADRCAQILRTSRLIDRREYMLSHHRPGLSGSWRDPAAATTYLWGIQPGGVGTVVLPSGQVMYFRWDADVIKDD